MALQVLGQVHLQKRHLVDTTGELNDYFKSFYLWNDFVTYFAVEVLSAFLPMVFEQVNRESLATFVAILADLKINS